MRHLLFLPRNVWRLAMNKYLYFLAAFIASDWLLYSKLSSMLLSDESQLEEMKPGEFHRVTIEQLIANISIPLDLLTKIPSRRRKHGLGEEEEGERTEFIYQRVTCNILSTIYGQRNIFRICYPPQVTEDGRLAYFINGQRDTLFEHNFKSMLDNGTQLKVFTSGAKSNVMDSGKEGADLVEDVEVKIYTEREVDENGQRLIGIKDLIDSHDDYHKMEFIKYEMTNVTDPIVFSINIPVFASHLLLRLEHFPYEEFRYLIKRLAYSLYYPYAVEHDRRNGIHFVSMIHKYSMYKYSVTESMKAKWRRKVNE